MILEHRHYPKNFPEVVMLLGFKPGDIEHILISVTFDVTKAVPATLLDPPEGGELVIQDLEILYLVDWKGVPITIHQRQREIISEFLNEDIIKQACWRCWNKYKDTYIGGEVYHE